MKLSEYRALIGQQSKKPKNKYRNVPTVQDGIRFDSKAEAKRYAELLLLWRAGEIVHLARQVRFELVPARPGERAVVYVADFTYTDRRTGKPVVEDVKGTLTPVYKLKRRLMQEVHGIEILETKMR